MQVKDYSKEHQKEIVEHARKCAYGTIETVYEKREDCSGLSDIEIDKVRDALQILMYIKSLE